MNLDTPRLSVTDVRLPLQCIARNEISSTLFASSATDLNRSVAYQPQVAKEHFSQETLTHPRRFAPSQ